MLACGIRMDDVLRKGNRIIGIRAGEDEILTTWLLLLMELIQLLVKKPDYNKLSRQTTGVKQVIGCRQKTIENVLTCNQVPELLTYAGTCTRRVCQEVDFYTL